MPSAARVGDKDTGHGCYPPRASLSGASKFFINGVPALRVGDPYDTHRCGNNQHAGAISAGSSKIFIEGAAAARIGDMISCGSAVAAGSQNVFFGG